MAWGLGFRVLGIEDFVGSLRMGILRAGFSRLPGV